MTLDQREKDKINGIISELRGQINDLLKRLDVVEAKLREMRTWAER